MKRLLLHSMNDLCFTCKSCGESFNGLGYRKGLCYPDIAGTAFTYFCGPCAAKENERRKRL